MATKALKTAWASAPKNDYIHETLELKHSKFSKTWYISNHQKTFDATLENRTKVTFEPIPFAVKLPPSDAQGGQLMDITVANAGLDMVKEIEAASTKPDERIEVVYRIYLSSDKTAPQNTPIRLSLDSIMMNDEAIAGQAGRSDVLNQPFPSEIYTPEKFPGLKR